MFGVGEKKETHNPAALLAGEHGTFRVISPSGIVARYDCDPIHSITNVQFLGRAEPRAQYLVEKIAEDVSSLRANFAPRDKTPQAA